MTFSKFRQNKAFKCQHNSSILLNIQIKSYFFPLIFKSQLINMFFTGIQSELNLETNNV